MHVLLRVGESRGEPVHEPVHVEDLGGGHFKLLFTPGLAYGAAADDVIKVGEDGSYEVVARGRNIAVRVFSENSVSEFEAYLTNRVQASLGGRLDGEVNRGLAYTVPVETGFKRIESLFTDFVAETPGTEWEYGNVYSEDGKPLGWWLSEA